MAPRTPRIDPEDARTNLLALARAYREGTLGVPSPFFPIPAPPVMTLTAQGEGPLGTHVVDLAYPSEYQPFLPAARDLATLRIRKS